MFIQISVYKPPWNYVKTLLCSVCFWYFAKNRTSSPTVAMFRLRLRVPSKHNKQDFKTANEILVRMQFIVTEGSMSVLFWVVVLTIYYKTYCISDSCLGILKIPTGWNFHTQFVKLSLCTASFPFSHFLRNIEEELS